MPKNLRPVTAFALAALVVAALAACGGNSIPGDSVARVKDTSIKKDSFNHWLTVAALSSASQTDPTAAASGKRPNVAIPDPPDFTKCVAAAKKAAPKPAKGQTTPSDATYKKQCQQQYASLRDQVMQFLISASWINQEAASRNVKLTDAEVKKQFDSTKKQSFPKDADYQNFLKSSGMTEADLLFRVRLDSLSNKLRTQVTKGKDNVTPAQISAYYNKNKSKFASAEKRDIRLVLTKTKAKAEQARAALKGGQSFKTVAKKFSIDQSSKANGGKLAGVQKGQQEQALDTAIFAAKKGVLTGPVKTQFGYYVFQVSAITPASQQTLAQATPTIKSLLASQGQQKALDAFVKDFQKKWKDRTTCRDGYKISDCKNGPKPKPATSTTAAPTGTTGQ
jgi:parvulin-like peptidyl-prolyl isomerase